MHMDALRPAHWRERPSPPHVLRLVSGLALIAALVTVAAGARAPGASAAGACTGWTNSIVPPSSVRVLRTSGPASGTVQTVPFRQYVDTVMAAEWSAGPSEAMKVGAIAVKQYAWYWTTVWRGRKAADGTCYDVVDTTQDQLYRPETIAPVAALSDAVDATWTISLHHSGRLFASGYRTGASVACGADADGQILYQTSLYRCARAGMTMDQLIHRYLDPVEIVRPGAGDATGDGLGDVSVVTNGGDTTNVRLYGSGLVAPPPSTAMTTALGLPVALPVPPAETIFRSVADVTGDGLDDFLLLQKLADGHYQIWVAPSTGDAFGPPALWWDSASSGIPFLPGGLVRFVTGDLTGDGRADAGLLVASDPTAVTPAPTATPSPTTRPTPTPPPSPKPTPKPSPSGTATPIPSVVLGVSHIAAAASVATATPTATPVPPTAAGPWATLWVLPGTGSGFGTPSAAWSGPLGLDGVTTFAGDVDGDGRADLVLQEDLAKQAQPGVGLRYAVVRVGAAVGSAPSDWLDLPDQPASAVRTVLGDVNGDGRADLILDRADGIGTQFVGLLSSGSGFAPRVLWTNATSFRWSVSRIASADVDGDGHGDIVVLYNAGVAGSRLYRFLSTGTSLKSVGATIDPTLVWAGAAPY